MDSQMTFLELVHKRSSIRKYKTLTVNKDLILRALEAARLAPSACNSQPWHFVIVDNPVQVQGLAEATFLPLSKLNRFVKEAPVIVAVVSEKPNVLSAVGGYIHNKPYYLMDVGMAVEHFCLQAAEDSLGTCIIGWFNEKKVKEYLRVPRRKSIPLLITLGYPEEDLGKVKHRIPVDSIYNFGFYSKRTLKSPF